MASLIRQNYHEDCEALINKQINMELYASYVYLSMSYYYDRDDVSLPGIGKFFKKASGEEREHAMKLLEAAKLSFSLLKLQPMQEWGTALNGLEAALSLEKQVNQSLLDLHKKGDSCGDPHLTNFLEEHYLEEQVEAIKEAERLHHSVKESWTRWTWGIHLR
ncbi:Ferritin, heavy subunit [Armadillidium nasatum]|uniref:Ferritin n=1 Tax=Armadillidium nasatum TaxID=96803 RepID=A0A5N5SQQ4_9CRUS|nr:Ferritin, heavy subunit [Armadillidium nasatum]